MNVMKKETNLSYQGSGCRLRTSTADTLLCRGSTGLPSLFTDRSKVWNTTIITLVLPRTPAPCGTLCTRPPNREPACSRSRYNVSGDKDRHSIQRGTQYLASFHNFNCSRYYVSTFHHPICSRYLHFTSTLHLEHGDIGVAALHQLEGGEQPGHPAWRLYESQSLDIISISSLRPLNHDLCCWLSE